MKQNNENAKNEDFLTPVELPGVKPEDYRNETSQLNSGPPDYTLPGYPSAEETAGRGKK